jgi:hypothetical protein
VTFCLGLGYILSGISSPPYSSGDEKWCNAQKRRGVLVCSHFTPATQFHQAHPGNVSIEFGPDMNYRLTTWTQPVLVGGELVSLFAPE